MVKHMIGSLVFFRILLTEVKQHFVNGNNENLGHRHYFGAIITVTCCGCVFLLLKMHTA